MAFSQTSEQPNNDANTNNAHFATRPNDPAGQWTDDILDDYAELFDDDADYAADMESSVSGLSESSGPQLDALPSNVADLYRGLLGGDANTDPSVIQ